MTWGKLVTNIANLPEVVGGGGGNNTADHDDNDGDKNILALKIIFISRKHLTIKAQKTMAS